jgi:hypothetical protein
MSRNIIFVLLYRRHRLVHLVVNHEGSHEAKKIYTASAICDMTHAVRDSTTPAIYVARN